MKGCKLLWLQYSLIFSSYQPANQHHYTFEGYISNCFFGWFRAGVANGIFFLFIGSHFLISPRMSIIIFWISCVNHMLSNITVPSNFRDIHNVTKWETFHYGHRHQILWELRTHIYNYIHSDEFHIFHTPRFTRF